MTTTIKIVRQPKKVKGFTEIINGVPLDMILIPPGSFMMGASEKEELSRERERPIHQVKVSQFFMGRYPITQAQWQAVARLPQEGKELELNPSRFKGDKRPVERVSWHDAIEFCARLSRRTGKNYRLPSEAEWEYACRANPLKSPLDSRLDPPKSPLDSRLDPPKSPLERGTSDSPTFQGGARGGSKPFHFGDTISTDLANYNGTNEKYGAYGRGKKGIYRQETTDVDHFDAANEFGLSDMHGNVWEWCADPWHDSYEEAPSDGSVWDEEAKNDNRYQNILENLDLLLEDSRRFVLRGGSWISDANNCRSAARSSLNARDPFEHHGFRVACA